MHIARAIFLIVNIIILVLFKFPIFRQLLMMYLLVFVIGSWNIRRMLIYLLCRWIMIEFVAAHALVFGIYIHATSNAHLPLRLNAWHVLLKSRVDLANTRRPYAFYLQRGQLCCVDVRWPISAGESKRTFLNATALLIWGFLLFLINLITLKDWFIRDL